MGLKNWTDSLFSRNWIRMVQYVTRLPTVEEFEHVLTAVGFRERDRDAIHVGLSNTLYSVCAVTGSKVIGTGRIIGDGGMIFLLTGIMVIPTFQRQGVGTQIVEHLMENLERLPYKNIVLEALPLEGTEEFYGRLGFTPDDGALPGMIRWFNSSEP